jgi:hypothetical protein
MNKFYDKFKSKQDKYAISQSNYFRVTFQSDFGILIGAATNVTTEDVDILMQSIDLPNIVAGSGDPLEIVNEYVSYVSTSNSILKPEQNSFTATFLNTIESPIENFFLPWMQQTMSSDNIISYPMPRSIVNVIFYKNQIQNFFGDDDIKYIYELDGVFPVHVDTPNPSHSAEDITRTVGFKFNNIRLKYNSIQQNNGVRK